MLPTALQKQYKLTKRMETELKRMLKVHFVAWANASLRALERRGLAAYVNEEVHREGWTLTGEGERIARML